MKKLETLLVKPAGPDCNLGCEYCFYLEKESLFGGSRPHRMSDTVLEETIRQALGGSGSSLAISWQGGEPTLMGLDFFEEAVELEKRHGRGQLVDNGLQTNGLKLDREWARFLGRYNFLVGLSLDGPEHVHDRYRKTRGGGATWSKVVDRARLLFDSGVEVNALSVVTDYSAKHARETYEFLKELGFTYQQYIPCVETLPDEPAVVAPFSVGPGEYGAFLVELFDLWLGDFADGVPTTSVRFFESVFHTYLDAEPPECTLLERCGNYLVVEHDGSVYSCDFYVDPEHRLGNVLEDDLTTLLASDAQRAFGEAKRSLHERCRRCRWLPRCRGGCPKDRLREAGHPPLNHLCRAFETFFEHADPHLRELADRWRAARKAEDRARAVRRAIERGELSPGRNDPCPCGSGLKFKKCCLER